MNACDKSAATVVIPQRRPIRSNIEGLPETVVRPFPNSTDATRTPLTHPLVTTRAATGRDSNLKIAIFSHARLGKRRTSDAASRLSRRRWARKGAAASARPTIP